MAASPLPMPARVAVTEHQLEDPLAYLPCSRISAYRKGQIIYDQAQNCTGIFLIIEGKVKVCRVAEDNRPVVVDIYQGEEFFGELALLDANTGREQAIALENTKVMTWTAAEIEQIVLRRPRLAIALLQILVQRTCQFSRRIESFSVDNISRRLARALLHFSDHFGREFEDGTVQVAPITHQLLAQFVGTTREIITQNMIEFRRQGYLDYSRKGIRIYRDALKDWLRHESRARLGIVTQGAVASHPQPA